MELEFKNGQSISVRILYLPRRTTGLIMRCSRDSSQRRHEKSDLYCLVKFQFYAGNLNLTIGPNVI
jgi:hypothetical protein